jgi:hypothetical protein
MPGRLPGSSVCTVTTQARYNSIGWVVRTGHLFQARTNCMLSDSRAHKLTNVPLRILLIYLLHLSYAFCMRSYKSAGLGNS